ncbi:hypothetical protein V6N13_147453 [Hibiscus sabdariffa]
MQNSGLELKIVFYNILIDGAYKSGHIKVAKELFHELFVNGLKPDVYTNNILINGLCKEGLPGEAYQLFRSIGKNDCLPDSISYNLERLRWLKRNTYCTRCGQMPMQSGGRLVSIILPRELVLNLVSRWSDVETMLADSCFVSGELQHHSFCTSINTRPVTGTIKEVEAADAIFRELRLGMTT